MFDRSMNKLYSRTTTFFSVLLGFLTILLLILFLKMKKANPDYSDKKNISTIKGTITIKKDAYGVPYIYAENNSDLYFGLGYAQAKERMFQIQLLKRIVAGRLSEVVGSKGLKVDKLMRTIGIRKNSIQWIEINKTKIPSEALDYINSYIKGFNYYLENYPKPVEFSILQISPEPIDEIDILSFVGFMGLGFAEAISVDPSISALEKIVSKEMFEEITGEVNKIALDTNSTKLLESSNLFADATDNLRSTLNDLGVPLFQGSNSWVISGSKSENGFPMLGNDPHIGFSNPSIWFEAYLKSPNHEIYGFFLPMVPFATIGFNSYNAWGLTMFENDDMDFYLEKENPNNPDEYLFKNQTLPYTKRNEEIKVRFSDTVVLEIKETIHGPILSGISNSLKKEVLPIAMKWPMYDNENNPINAFYGLNHAKTLKEFDSSIGFLLAPGLNFVYADKEGNIAHFSAGAIPKRGFKSDRLLDGSSGLYEWGAFVPPSERPKNINPKKGYIFTANHKHHENVNYPIEGYWQSDDRTGRLQKLFEHQTIHSLGSMKTMILDGYFESSDYLIPVFLKRLEPRERYLSEVDKKVLNILKSWDRIGNPNEAGALVFSELRIQLIRLIFLDEMGEDLFENFGVTVKFHHYLKKVFLNENSKWWDNKLTSKIESSEDICELALIRTTASLLSKEGSDLSKWKWGNQHTLELKHALGEIPPLNLVFNSGPRSMPAGSETLNNLLTKVVKMDHKITAGPSMRMLIDFSQLDNVQLINPLGQSGHRINDHFQDQAELFQKGFFRTIQINNELLVPQKNITILSPK
jgi:penicillin G amidase